MKQLDINFREIITTPHRQTIFVPVAEWAIASLPEHLRASTEKFKLQSCFEPNILKSCPQDSDLVYNLLRPLAFIFPLFP